MIGHSCRQKLSFIRHVVFVVMFHCSQHNEGVICIRKKNQIPFSNRFPDNVCSYKARPVREITAMNKAPSCLTRTPSLSID